MTANPKPEAPPAEDKCLGQWPEQPKLEPTSDTIIYIRSDLSLPAKTEVSQSTYKRAAWAAQQLAKLIKHHNGQGLVKTDEARQRPKGHWFGASRRGS